MKRSGIKDFVGINPKGAEPDCSKLFVANGDGIGGTPFLIQLKTGAEEVDVRLEGGLKQLVPVHEVCQQRQSLSCQLVSPRSENVGDAAFVDKNSHLRLAHG